MIICFGNMQVKIQAPLDPAEIEIGPDQINFIKGLAEDEDKDDIFSTDTVL